MRLYELAQAGQWGAWALQRTLWRANKFFQKYSLATCVKTALQLQGFAVGDAIAPQELLTRDAVAEIRAALEMGEACCVT